MANKPKKNIKVKGKKFVSLHTSGTKNPTNKSYILLNEDKIARYIPNHGICVLKPMIDRMVIEYNLQDYDTNQLVELYDHIPHSLTVDAINKLGYKSVDLFHLSKAQYMHYHVNVRLYHAPTNQNILIQVKPKNHNKPFIRIDFNPCRLGPAGIKFMKDKLKEDFSVPDADFDFNHILKWERSIFRMDIAVDILGLDVGEAYIQWMKAGKLCPEQTHVYTSPSGRYQTIYPKSEKGKSSNSYLYNKKAELIKNNKQPMYGANIRHARFEHRVNKTKLPIENLGKLQNHLKKVSIKTLDHNVLADKDHKHWLFAQAVKGCGMKKVVSNIPEELQSQYLDTYDKAMMNIWNPEELWSYWPDVIKQSGLLD